MESPIFQSLSSKHLDVFYDTVFHVQKTDRHDIMSIYKLDFNFDTETLDTINIPYTIDFGDSGSAFPHTAARSCFVDTILSDSDKSVLICGLSCVAFSVQQIVDGVTYMGNAYCPIIHRYDINEHTLHKIYPLGDDVNQWARMVQGFLTPAQAPLVSLDVNNGVLGFIYKTKQLVNSSYNIRCYIDIDFKYKSGNIELDNARIINSADTDGNYAGADIQKYIRYDNKKLLIAAATIANTKKILLLNLNDVSNPLNTEIMTILRYFRPGGGRYLRPDTVSTYIRP